MTTITRQQLRDAIEAGIAAAEPIGDFRDGYASALRKVGDEADEVARGTYAVIDAENTVRCPVAQAFEYWPAVAGAWNLEFARVFDRSARAAVGWSADATVLHITDNEGSTEGAA